MVAAVAPAPSQATTPINPPAAADNAANDASTGTEAAGNADSFAAVMQKQIGRQSGDARRETNGASNQANSHQAASSQTAANATETQEPQDVAADLAALLPFLEAAGLVSKNTSPTTDSAAADAQSELKPENPLSSPTDGQSLTPAAILPTAPLPAAPVATGEVASPPAAALPAALTPTLPKANPSAATANIAAEKTDAAATTGLAAMETAGAGANAPPEAGTAKTTFAAELATIQKTMVGGESTLPNGDAGHAEQQLSQQSTGTTLTPTQMATAATGHTTDTTATQHVAAAQQIEVAAPVGSHQWGRELGDKVVWMTHRMESRAEMVLNPPQMGRIEVSLSVTGDQANAVFSSTNPVVREALEAAMPRLREVLADAGIQLGQAQVGAENARQFAQQEKNGDNFGAGRDAAFTGTTAPQAMAGGSDTPISLKAGRGLVDVFA